MKKHIWGILIIGLILLTLLPLPALAEEGEELPPTTAPLVIDTTTIYEGMAMSYKNGYMPTVENGVATFVLPLLGSTAGNILRVTPNIRTDGPFVYGNYQFEVSRRTVNDTSGNLHEVFLIQLTIPLAPGRINGIYPVEFVIDYRDSNGEQAQQSFTLQLSITDGKKPPSQGGGGGQAAAHKPVLLISQCNIVPSAVDGGGAFSVTLHVENVGDREAKNIRISFAPLDGEISFEGEMNALFVPILLTEEFTIANFKLKAEAVALAGEHFFTASVTYEDKYGAAYTEEGNFRIRVSQPVSVDFDRIKLPESLESGTSFEQPIAVYNTGFAPVYNVKCSVQLDGILAATAYLGKIEPQNSADKIISMFVTTLNSRNNLYGYTSGSLIISYTDATGQEYTEYLELSTSIAEPNIPTDEELEKQKQAQKEQQTLSQWWISLLIGIAIIAVLVSVIIIAKFSRMMKMK
ncbi:MAG: hypothetical protein FWF10_07810 [Clostridiales bacterium]|nr:hypothetical protein [Clostridiales bacterium]